MAIGTGALGQYAIGQSQVQNLAIQPPLVVNTNTFYSFDLGKQYLVAPLVANTNVIYQRIGVWNPRVIQAETWMERTRDSETWTRAA